MSNPSRAKADRGRDQLRQRQPARSVLAMRKRKTCDRPRHADRKPRVARFRRIGLALVVEEASRVVASGAVSR
jgi:hypothetical protein